MKLVLVVITLLTANSYAQKIYGANWEVLTENFNKASKPNLNKYVHLPLVGRCFSKLDPETTSPSAIIISPFKRGLKEESIAYNGSASQFYVIFEGHVKRPWVKYEYKDRRRKDYYDDMTLKELDDHSWGGWDSYHPFKESKT